MKIFETHAHYDDEAFDADRYDLIEGFLNGVGKAIMNVGSSIATSRSSVALAKKYDNVYAAVGVHPDEVGELEKEGLAPIRELICKEPCIKAVGEIGLDYYEHEEGERTTEVKELQKKWFREQLLLAKEVDLPIIVHSRDAAEDTWNILSECGFPRGVIHCYSYSSEMAERFVKAGYYLGFGGAITFKNAKKNVKSLKTVGLDHIVLETDCPYMAPVPLRGTRNNSENLVFVVKKAAEILEVSEEEIVKKTFSNALDLYGIKDL